jgi:hypothetical protein
MFIKVDILGCLWYLTRASDNRVIKNLFVRFEVFTAVTMKNGVFWDVTPCGSHGVTSQKTSFFKNLFDTKPEGSKQVGRPRLR